MDEPYFRSTLPTAQTIKWSESMKKSGLEWTSKSEFFHRSGTKIKSNWAKFSEGHGGPFLTSASLKVS